MPSIIESSPITFSEQEEMQEIIGHPPGWILRWGVMVALGFVVILGVMSWLIEYPDILAAPVIITTENPVIRVMTKTSGKVEYLFAKDQAIVQKDQAIILIENSAKWEDIQLMQTFLGQLNNRNYATIELPENLVLGVMQSTYANLLQLLKTQRYHLAGGSDNIKRLATENQIKYYQSLNKSLERQIQLFQEEIDIAKDQFQITQELFEAGSASANEVKLAEAQLLQQKRSLENIQSQMLTHQVRIEQLRTQITDITQQRKDGNLTNQLAIEEQVRRLKNELIAWEQNFLLKAPISGQLVMNTIKSPQQFIDLNTEAFTILPLAGKGAIVARANMPIQGIGKVKKGMLANISLGAYPVQEFGVLKASVEKISNLAKVEPSGEASYQLELSLINDLTTTYDKEISLQQEMSGTAEIITENKRILERIFNQISNILKNK